MARARRQSVDLEYLEGVEKELRRRVNALKAIRMAMKNKKMKELSVNGTGMLERSYGYLDTFVFSCKKEAGEL